MGSEMWAYTVPYQADITKAFHELRERELRAGRYYPVELTTPFFPDPNTPGPGGKHETIQDVWEDEDAQYEGTHSILDMQRIGTDEDTFELAVVTPLSEETVIEYFETSRPSPELVRKRIDAFVELGRGEAAYVVAYRDGKAAEIFFIGWTFD